MFSALYVSATGITALGERMQTIGNNLAKVSTVAYKEADTLFATLISRQMATGSNRFTSGVNDLSQIGMGVGVEAIRTDFSQGSITAGSENTDMAIAGRGFFGLRNPADSSLAYTRAGNFRFDSTAYLTNPSGLRLQGYAVDRATGAVATAVTDIQLPYEDVTVDGVQTRVVRCPAQATSLVTLETNLNYSAEDRVQDASNPFFALFTNYDGASGSFGSQMPSYQTTMTVYDESGATHTLTFSYDRVDSTLLSNAVSSNRYWEFMITVDPSEDGRGGIAGTSAAGVLGFGTISFNRYGEMIDESFFTLTGAIGSNAKSLSNWGPSAFSATGYPSFNVIFALSNGGVTAGQSVAVNFGLLNSNASWITGSNTTAASVGRNVNGLPRLSSVFRDVYATTDYEAGSATLMHSQDGYPVGYLQSLSVDALGFLTGHFSNNQNLALAQVALYRFTSEDGLRRDGGNVFLETEASGAAVAGKPGENGRGTIEQESLEASNVDIAAEFVNMITTQRGFQANTKVMTTADSILQTAMQTKR